MPGQRKSKRGNPPMEGLACVGVNTHTVGPSGTVPQHITLEQPNAHYPVGCCMARLRNIPAVP